MLDMRGRSKGGTERHLQPPAPRPCGAKSAAAKNIDDPVHAARFKIGSDYRFTSRIDVVLSVHSLPLLKVRKFLCNHCFIPPDLTA